MTQWYIANQRLFREERARLARSCPLMMLSVVAPGFPINSVFFTRAESAIAHGTYTLIAPSMQHEIEYGISVCLPEKYPQSPPIMFCNDPKLPVDTIDRHILNDGQACLEVLPEIRRRWPPGANLVDFMVNLVAPFLAWQVYYDAFGKPPEWGERAHGEKGIIQYYAEMLGLPENHNIVGFMKLLARKNRPKGHEPCPCNSGLKLRNCHQESVNAVLDGISWREIRFDYELLTRNGEKVK